MPWTKPDFQEITLNMEVTGYVNTGDEGGDEPHRHGDTEKTEERKN